MDEKTEEKRKNRQNGNTSRLQEMGAVPVADRMRNLQDLTDDLIYMRKASGFSASRIGMAGTLGALLGGGQEEPFESLKVRFVSAVNSLAEDEAALLRAAYALESPYDHVPSIRQRREAYGQTINRGVDTVESRERESIRHLAVQLLTGWYPASPMGARVPELHGGIVTERFVHRVVVNDGYLQETHQQHRFLALFDEMDYLNIGYNDGQVLESLNEFTIKSRQSPGGYSQHFYSPEPMRRGNMYTLDYKARPFLDDQERTRITESSMAFHDRVLASAFSGS